MKGFVKACLIAVLVFVVAGIVLLVVAAAGGVTRASLRLFSEQGRLGYGSMNIRLFDGFGITFGQDDREMVIVDGSDDDTIAISQVKELQLDANVGDCYIMESPDGRFYVEGARFDVEVNQVGDCLMIDHHVSPTFEIGFSKADQMVVYVPAGHQFDSVTLIVGAGSLEIDLPIYSRDCILEVGAGSMAIDADVTADDVKMNVGAGEIDGYGSVTARDQMELTVGVGNISLERINCEGTLKTDCGVGSLYAEGFLAGDLNARVDAGEVELELRSDGQNYTYTMEVGAGEIEVNDYSYSGIDNKITLEGDAGAPVADLSCGVGSLEINIR